MYTYTHIHLYVRTCRCVYIYTYIYACVPCKPHDNCPTSPQCPLATPCVMSNCVLVPRTYIHIWVRNLPNYANSRIECTLQCVQFKDIVQDTSKSPRTVAYSAHLKCIHTLMD